MSGNRGVTRKVSHACGDGNVIHAFNERRCCRGIESSGVCTRSTNRRWGRSFGRGAITHRDRYCTATGKARRAILDISGTGAANLAALELEEAEIGLSGAGKATLGPKSSAKVDVSGIGEIELTRRPARLEQNISGAGRVSQPGLPG